MWVKLSDKRGKYYFGSDKYAAETCEMFEEHRWAVIGMRGDPAKIGVEEPTGGFFRTPVSTMWISECGKFMLHPTKEEFEGFIVSRSQDETTVISKWFPSRYWPEYHTYGAYRRSCFKYCYKDRKFVTNS
jgi:hypothetical protein